MRKGGVQVQIKITTHKTTIAIRLIVTMKIVAMKTVVVKTVVR